MKEHRWELTRTEQFHADGTRYDWECADCHSKTFTKSDPVRLGTHAAEHYRPGRRALQATWVDADCNKALVDRVHEL